MSETEKQKRAAEFMRNLMDDPTMPKQVRQDLLDEIQKARAGETALRGFVKTARDRRNSWPVRKAALLEIIKIMRGEDTPAILE